MRNIFSMVSRIFNARPNHNIVKYLENNSFFRKASVLFYNKKTDLFDKLDKKLEESVFDP